MLLSPPFSGQIFDGILYMLGRQIIYRVLGYNRWLTDFFPAWNRIFFHTFLSSMIY